MKTRLFRIAAFLIVVMACAATAHADAFIDPYDGYDESAAMDMELEENLATPIVGNAEHASIARYMKALAERLGQKYKVELMRAGEVIVVTIPTDDLFAPNDTLLMPGAGTLLRPMLPLFRDGEMFKLIFAVHTDDTGSEQYKDDLSAARSHAIYGWLLDDGKVNDELFIINYEMGDSRPIVSNDSRVNRAKNRRVELFIVPGPKLITLAHNNKLK